MLKKLNVGQEQRINEVTEKTDLLRAEIALKKAITRINVKEL